MMTKKVRIENADTSSHKLVVQVWQMQADGEPHVMTAEHAINGPTDMVEAYVYGAGQYLVVREV